MASALQCVECDKSSSGSEQHIGSQPNESSNNVMSNSPSSEEI